MANIVNAGWQSELPGSGASGFVSEVHPAFLDLGSGR